jgi:cAMP-binding proteins - catabolite gene activator and regulatory subunit of cAMP-dependent protein kinases
MIVNDKYVDTLLKTDLFQGMEKTEILKMLDCLQPKVSAYKKNDYIVNYGETFECIGMILYGEAAVSKENAAGQRIVMTMLAAGDVFGEVVAFSSQKAWPATVQAQTDCDALFLPREKIVGECANICPWHRILIRNFLRIISERALFLNKRVEYLTIKSIRGKVSTYLLEQYEKAGDIHFTIPLSRNELADFLNVSRPSMCRELAKLKDESIIDFYLSSFKVLNVAALKTISIS